MTTDLSPQKEAEFSITFLNRIPQSIKTRIPGYKILAAPIPGLSFLDSDVAMRLANVNLKKTPAAIPNAAAKALVKQSSVSLKSLTLQGELKMGKTAKYSVNEIDFGISDNAFLVGEPSIGKQAKVVLKRAKNGGWTASSVYVETMYS